MSKVQNNACRTRKAITDGHVEHRIMHLAYAESSQLCVRKLVTWDLFVFQMNIDPQLASRTYEKLEKMESTFRQKCNRPNLLG